MQRERYLVPGAILVGAAMIGAGLYFGLAARASAERPTSARGSDGAKSPEGAAQPPSGVRPTDSAAVVRGEAPSPPAVAVAPALVGPEKAASPSQRRVVEVAMEEAKVAQFRPRCWDPIVARAASPAASRYRMRFVFDAAGRERSRGVSELRGEPSRPDVARCLRDLPLGLEVGPLGEVVAVELELAFP